MRTSAEWQALLRRMDRGAEESSDPAHRKWCAGQARVIRKRMKELKIEERPLEPHCNNPDCYKPDLPF